VLCQRHQVEKYCSDKTGSEFFIVDLRQNLLLDEILPSGENGRFSTCRQVPLTDRIWILFEFREKSITA